MASYIFSRSRGHVLKISDPLEGPGRSLVIRFSALSGVNAIIENVSVNPKPLYEVTDSLGDLIHITTFSETLTAISLQGLCFDLCDTDQATGLEQLLDFYDENVVVYRDAPLVLQLGRGRVLDAYCFEFTARLANPELRVWRFEMQLGAVPKKKRSRAEAAAAATAIAPVALPAPTNAYIGAGYTGSQIGSNGGPTVSVSASRAIGSTDFSYRLPQGGFTVGA